MTDTHRAIVQRGPGWRWCLLCCDWRATKGGTFKNGFRCAMHRKEAK